VAAIATVVALLSGGYVANDIIEGSQAAAPSATPSSTSRTNGPTPTVAADPTEPVAAVAEAVAPAVVLISTGQGLGSGVIYDESGLILTNAHVVGAARQVRVGLADGTTVEGEVLGADQSTDIAVVRLTEARDLAVARFADEEPRVGQLAVALGSPFGLEQTVTAGIVSAVDRPVPNDRGIAVNMLQTDAPINPGNSGGALANRKGEVIGINTAIFSQSGENNGIGFAVPIATAARVAERIVSGRPLERPRLGIEGDDRAAGPGAVVGRVVPGGPADQAGLEAGDRIVAIDGEPVRSFSSLQGEIGTRSPGDTVTLEIERDGSTLTVEVTLGTAE
jgi:S1-C subfamily serine protease